MTFADLLNKEIAKKRAQVDSLKGPEKRVKTSALRELESESESEPEEPQPQPDKPADKPVDEAINTIEVVTEELEPQEPGEGKARTKPAEEAPIDYIIRTEDIADDINKVMLQIRAYLKGILLTWKTSTDKEYEFLVETKRWIVPLLVKLKRASLPIEMAISVSTVTHNLQNKEYMKANENYLKLSIGNIAWPIGVMHVGIHARSADDRITGSEGNVSNIMKDDKTRHWLLALKRLITHVETNEL